MEPFGELPIRSIAVDLANLRLDTDQPVLMGKTERQPLLFRDITDIMRALEELQLGVPIFYVIDARVNPHGMRPEEEAFIRELESRDPRYTDRIWRMKQRRFGISKKEDAKSLLREKADVALCDLANALDTAIISGDRFGEEARTGRLARPDSLVRFEANRTSRDHQFGFSNRSRQFPLRNLETLTAHLTDEEYWDEWCRGARILADHMHRQQKKDDREVIDHYLSTRTPKTEKNRKSRVVTRSTDFSHIEVTFTGTDSSAPEAVTEIHEQDVPVPVPVVAPVPVAVIPEAAFIFRDLHDLKTHVDQPVEMISRIFRQDTSLYFRLYGSGMGVLLDVPNASEYHTSHEFMSATGVLRRLDSGWVLTSARVNGTVTAAELESMKDAGRQVSRPTFSPWGRLPRWRWSKSSGTELPLNGSSPTEPDHTKEHDLPVREPNGGATGATTPTADAAPGEAATQSMPPNVIPFPTRPGLKTGDAGTDTSVGDQPAKELETLIPEVAAPGDGTPDTAPHSTETETETATGLTQVTPTDGDGETAVPVEEDEGTGTGEVPEPGHRRLAMAAIAFAAAVALVIPFRILVKDDPVPVEAPTPATVNSGGGNSRSIHLR